MITVLLQPCSTDNIMHNRDRLLTDRFSLLQSVTLYADVNGRQFPVTRGQDVGKYQV